ncbi:MAG: hypothetical protein QJR01_07775 [Kyrpidia sp.]|nr:hypothetical protein [Kyrpidia sp.]
MFVLRRRRRQLAAFAVMGFSLLTGCAPAGSPPTGLPPGSTPSDALQAENAQLKSEVDELRRRLAALEPDSPTTRPLSSIERQVTLFEATHAVLPVADVLRSGTDLPFVPVVTDTRWHRPGYSGIWHSTYMDGKYSNVEQLVEWAAHRGYVYTGGLSAAQDLLYGLGIVTNPDSAAARGGNLPLQDTRSDHVSLLVVYGEVQKVTRLGKQVVVTVKPGTSGYQEARLRPRDITGASGPEAGGAGNVILFQFITPDGSPFDTCVADLAGVQE